MQNNESSRNQINNQETKTASVTKLDNQTNQNTKRLHVRVYCEAFYDSYIDVPKNMNLKDAFEYASEHTDEIPVTNITALDPSDSELDPEDLNNETHTYFEQ